MTQTILGAGGAIGQALAIALRDYTIDIRLVSRNPKKLTDSDQLFAADLTKADEVMDAVQGSSIAYLTVGLLYDTVLWQNTWPKIMANVIAACLKHNCKLVFFDNIYMYDKNLQNPMTEEHPINPPSEKGKVRAAIVDQLYEAHRKDGLQFVIARCADFYGAGIKNVSILTETVFKPLSEGKTANLLMRSDCMHAFTYVPDAAKATAMLGNTPEIYGEVWHLPTAQNPPTGKEWVEAIAQVMGVKPKFRIAGTLMVKFIGLFVPAMKESVEMLYQYDRHYVFSSQKFEDRFKVTPTPYAEGIAAIVKADYTK